MDVLYGHNDPMAEGAYIAGADAGIDLCKVLFVGIDALPTPDGGIMSVLDGRLGVTFVYPTGGKQAIDWAHRMLVDGVNPPLWLVLPFDTVSPENAQAVCDAFACPAAGGALPRTAHSPSHHGRAAGALRSSRARRKRADTTSCGGSGSCRPRRLMSAPLRA